MTVNGGRVTIRLGEIDLSGYPPRIPATIDVIPNFPDDMPELVSLIYKRLAKTQAEINLEICGILEDGEDLE